MRRRRALFLACLTAGTLAGTAAALHAVACGLMQPVTEMSPDNARFGLVTGALGGQFLGFVTWSVLGFVGELRRRPLHALHGAAVAGAVAAVLVWFPLWIFVAAAASC